MADAPTIELTKRQRQVADLLSRHFGLKEIALELGIAVSTVSDHVAALKRIFDATSHAEIVSGYLALTAGIAPDDGPEKRSRHFFRITESSSSGSQAVPDDPGKLGFGDGADYPLEWPTLAEPQVVPRLLDGNNATTWRLAVIACGVFGLVAGLVLAISATISVSQMVNGSEPDLALREHSAT
ncbi:response regulator transcription factor [Aurantiacibacter spongiae]|nr:helix-turn-helix transcriptional regulator [Aurantiacibacter spongiae]